MHQKLLTFDDLSAMVYCFYFYFYFYFYFCMVQVALFPGPGKRRYILFQCTSKECLHYSGC